MDTDWIKNVILAFHFVFKTLQNKQVATNIVAEWRQYEKEKR